MKFVAILFQVFCEIVNEMDIEMMKGIKLGLDILHARYNKENTQRETDEIFVTHFYDGEEESDNEDLSDNEQEETEHGVSVA